MDKIVYISYCQMIDDVRDWCRKLQISGVAGIPRSGSLVANIIAHELNIPLYFIAGDSLNNSRPDISRPINKRSGPILIVDDTSWSGRAMSYTRRMFAGELNVIYGALYCSAEQAPALDVYYKVLDTKYHTFEWNILRDVLVSDFYIDFDGVLCEDPTVPDDTPAYMDFLKNAIPKYLPKYPVGGIVTARLHIYEEETKGWLDKYDIKYNSLIMSPYKTSQDRLRNFGFGTWKAEIYKNSDKKLFIESNSQQAEEIFIITGKPVFCTDTMLLYQRRK
ncbi:MAG TPA: hypothetical protein V6C58_24245 [Allocoleopsis sp.]